MRRGLSVGDLGDLVELPLVATLATYRADGSVLLSPVWHEHVAPGFVVCSSWDDVKVRHLRRNPKAVLLLAESRPPYRGVELRAEAELCREGVEESLRRIAARYLGDAGAEIYLSSARDDTVIRLLPGELRARDFSDTALGRPADMARGE